MQAHEEGSESTWSLVFIAVLGGIAILYAASLSPAILQATGLPHLGLGREGNEPPVHPFAELLKLVTASLIGIVVTTVHKRYHRDKPLPRSLLQAQVLLCVAGAMVMVIIGNSAARAFGVLGAAGMIRFRTPVEDPKDTTILFLLVGLGMACGAGLVEVAGLGAAFVCLVLVVLDRFGEARARAMVLSVVASGNDFPVEHVHRVLGANVDHYEAREVINGAEAIVRFNVIMTAHTPIGWLSQELMAGGSAGLKSVSWSEPSKKGA
jgi:hypothetical protein